MEGYMRLNTGNAFEDVGNYQKQKGVLELSLKITEQHYGPEDPNVARSPYRLGHAVGNPESYQKQKQKELLECRLKIMAQHYEPEHPEIAWAMHTEI